MSGHTLKVTYERDCFRAHLECHEPEDAGCRNLPDCDCEYYSAERDDKGWYHMAYDDEDEKVRHDHDVRVKEGGECNMQAWINADTPDELGPDKTFVVADFPVKITWDEDYYTWAPKEAK